MNDAKTKLGQVKPYEYDASKFKGELKAQLMQEYRKKHGIEEVFEDKVEKKSFFNFNKLVLTPIMAVLVLTVFIGYEYMSKPMTAYAYLKQVEKHHKSLKKSGVKVRTTHTIDGYAFDVESVRDMNGNLKVAVIQDGIEVENFVMNDGVLYVKEKEGVATVESLVLPEVSDESKLADSMLLKSKRVDGLNSIISSMVLADLADPQNEWEELMAREDAKFSKGEDGLVRITYEEEVGGEVFVNELQFRDFEPVRKLHARKDVRPGAVALDKKIDMIEYHELSPLKEKVIPMSDHIVFVQNAEFNSKITDFVAKELDGLVEEYTDLPEKDPYFVVWNDRKRDFTSRKPEIAALTLKEHEELPAIDLDLLKDRTVEDIDLLERRVIVDSDVVEGVEFEMEVSPTVLPLPKVLDIRVDAADVVVPIEIPAIELPVGALPSIPVSDIPSKEAEIGNLKLREVPTGVSSFLKESSPLIRDAYIEEVFYDLLEDSEPREVRKKPITPKVDPLQVGDGKITPEPLIIPVQKDIEEPMKKIDGGIKDRRGETVPTIPTLPKTEFHNINLPGAESERDLDYLTDRDLLIDDSIPEPYMAEPMDPVIVPHVDPVKTESYTDILRNRTKIQDAAAAERLRLRMEKETKELSPRNREAQPSEPNDEFDRGVN